MMLGSVLNKPSGEGLRKVEDAPRLGSGPHEVSFSWWLGWAVRLHHLVSHVGGFSAG